MKWSALAEKVHQSLTRNALLKEKDKILIALSGGMDSVVLLHVLLELQGRWHWDLTVGHIDHGLRPGEDEKESGLCKELARSAGMPYYEESLKLENVDAKALVDYGTQKPSLESMARHRRYQIFEKWAEEFHCDAVCTAHHLSDQAETILYRLLTGSGLKGLTGISGSRNVFKRPLLNISKKEIREYAKKHKLDYLEDSSNADEKFIRNKIRRKVFPFLKDLGFEQAEDMLASSSRSVEEGNQALEFYTEKAYKDLIGKNGELLRVDLDKFIALPVFIKKTLVRKIFKESLSVKKHLSEKQLDELISFAGSAETGTASVLMGNRILKDRHSLVFSKNDGKKVLGHLRCEPSSTLQNNSVNIEVMNMTPEKLLIPDNVNTAYFSYGIFDQELVFRSWRPGDRIKLFGSGKSKKVSDILKDEKVSALKKEHYPVLLMDGEIIWIPGVKRSDLYKVNPQDDKYIQITYRRMESDNDQKNLNA